MNKPPDEAIVSTLAVAKSLAQQYASQGGDVSDLFAAFVGIVTCESREIGLRCLSATDRFLKR